MRYKAVWEVVKNLYKKSDKRSAHWIWENHVQFVAHKALEIAEKVKGDKDKSVSGALLHDIADIELKRSDESHEVRSLELARDILGRVDFTREEIDEIIENILKPHSCYPENMPKTLEGKIVATADALGHLTTNFYDEMTVGKLKDFGMEMSNEEYRKWAREKIYRDFNSKIFFAEIREAIFPRYQKLKEKFK